MEYGCHKTTRKLSTPTFKVLTKALHLIVELFQISNNLLLIGSPETPKTTKAFREQANFAISCKYALLRLFFFKLTETGGEPTCKIPISRF